MKSRLDFDTLVYEGTMLEDLSNGAYRIDDVPAKARESGLLFRPNSNLTEEEFNAKESDQKERYCLTMIDKQCTMLSWVDLTHEEARQKIAEKEPELLDSDDGYIQVFNMKDAISLNDYLKEIKS